MKLNGLKIFITGGAGFIGSNLVKTFLQEGAKVKVYDNFATGKIENIKDVLPKIELVKGDILNKRRLTNSMKGADLVSHHAAQMELTIALKNPYFDLEANTTGTINILESCVKNKIKKLINASSACVYGQKGEIPTKEDDSTNPNWQYGVSKLAAEKYCQIYTDTYNFPIISFRYSIIYGPNEWYGRVMSLFLKRAVEEKPIIVFGNGNQKRDFTHVSDVVQANVKAILDNKLKSEVFNISTGKGTTITDLSRLIKRYIEKTAIIYDSVVKEGETSRHIRRIRLPSELQNMILDTSKAKRLLGYKPTIALPEGLQQQIEWVRENKSRWKKISI